MIWLDDAKVSPSENMFFLWHVTRADVLLTMAGCWNSQHLHKNGASLFFWL